MLFTCRDDNQEIGCVCGVSRARSQEALFALLSIENQVEMLLMIRESHGSGWFTVQERYLFFSVIITEKTIDYKELEILFKALANLPRD